MKSVTGKIRLSRTNILLAATDFPQADLLNLISQCFRYWPYDTQPVYYGDIQVTIMNESLFPDWNVTEFRMMRGCLLYTSDAADE